ncbi:2-oxoacid:ferredoxin oxidoreductase subunit gamma [candidate division WOR-3 bacterium 4484_100]|uniref:2-oxoacid:ferredoxin oxidoreductase subunit gamma n=1 Tax=candidate division WOR-3 bacterium 4484_100 TaxID=1936077 RepID=A0A1V4QHT4_UNCW3|nr:MAG: 2-oxoacid:ferredoxin oxidoreductase subunit gamma [candidate division WOR-3 bacterium 4484_100]
MTKEVIVAGFGGQGIVSSGIILAYAGMFEDRHVTFFPSYGAEMRGGTANCSVVISSSPVASPIVAEPDVLIIMNEPSLLRFEPRLKPNGLLLYNKTLIKSEPKRSDITIIPVPANAIAEELGQGRIANMVMLGVLAKKTGILQLATLKKAQRIRYKKASEEQLSLNDQALERGYSFL